MDGRASGIMAGMRAAYAVHIHIIITINHLFSVTDTRGYKRRRRRAKRNGRRDDAERGAFGMANLHRHNNHPAVQVIPLCRRLRRDSAFNERWQVGAVKARRPAMADQPP